MVSPSPHSTKEDKLDENSETLTASAGKNFARAVTGEAIGSSRTVVSQLTPTENDEGRPDLVNIATAKTQPTTIGNSLKSALLINPDQPASSPVLRMDEPAVHSSKTPPLGGDSLASKGGADIALIINDKPKVGSKHENGSYNFFTTENEDCGNLDALSAASSNKQKSDSHIWNVEATNSSSFEGGTASTEYSASSTPFPEPKLKDKAKPLDSSSLVDEKVIKAGVRLTMDLAALRVGVSLEDRTLPEQCDAGLPSSNPSPSRRHAPLCASIPANLRNTSCRSEGISPVRESKAKLRVDCPCTAVFADYDSTKKSNAITLTCSVCNEPVAPLVDLFAKFSALSNNEQRLEAEIFSKSKLLQHEKALVKSLKVRLEKLEDDLLAKSSDLSAAESDMRHLSNRLVQEATKRIDFEHQANDVQSEIESLTQSLFETANELVAAESRKRHVAELESKSLSDALQQREEELSIAQSQLKDLKRSLVSAVGERDEIAHKFDAVSRQTSNVDMTVSLNGSTTRAAQFCFDVPLSGGSALDRFQLSSFAHFAVACQALPPYLWHNLPFFAHCLHNDIIPCLTFAQLASVKPWRDDNFFDTAGAKPAIPHSVPIPSSADSSPLTPTRKLSAISLEFGENIGWSLGKINASELASSILANSCQIEELSTRPDRSSIASRGTSCVACLRQQELPCTDYRLSFVSHKPSRRSSLVLNGIGRLGGKSPSADQAHSRLFSQEGSFSNDVEYEHVYIVCKYCRDQIVAVCDFVGFLRQISLSLHQSKSVYELFREFCVLQREMFVARWGIAFGDLELARKAELQDALKSSLAPEFQNGVTLQTYSNSVDFLSVLHSTELEMLYKACDGSIADFKRELLEQQHQGDNRRMTSSYTGWGFPWRRTGSNS